MERVIRKLKKRKAAGVDGLQNEVWIWEEKGLKSALWKLCKRIWRGGRVSGEMERGYNANSKEKRRNEGGRSQGNHVVVNSV